MSKALIESMVFRLFFLCIALDLLVQPQNQVTGSDPTPDSPPQSSPYEPPSKRFPSHSTEDEESFKGYKQTESNVVEILYCTSWSYKNNFQQVKELIQTDFPGLEVIGEEYPPGPINKLLSRVCSGLQFGLIALNIAGDRIFQGLGIAEPGFYRYMKERKMIAFFFIFIIGNNLSSYFWSTGAFEITFRDQVVFSKLKMNRMPYVQEILENIKEIRGL